MAGNKKLDPVPPPPMPPLLPPPMPPLSLMQSWNSQKEITNAGNVRCDLPTAGMVQVDSQKNFQLLASPVNYAKYAGNYTSHKPSEMTNPIPLMDISPSQKFVTCQTLVYRTCGYVRSPRNFQSSLRNHPSAPRNHCSFTDMNRSPRQRMHSSVIGQPGVPRAHYYPSGIKAVQYTSYSNVEVSHQSDYLPINSPTQCNKARIENHFIDAGHLMSDEHQNSGAPHNHLGNQSTLSMSTRESSMMGSSSHFVSSVTKSTTEMSTELRNVRQNLFAKFKCSGSTKILDKRDKTEIRSKTKTAIESTCAEFSKEKDSTSLECQENLLSRSRKKLCEELDILSKAKETIQQKILSLSSKISSEKVLQDMGKNWIARSTERRRKKSSHKQKECSQEICESESRKCLLEEQSSKDILCEVDKGHQAGPAERQEITDKVKRGSRKDSETGSNNWPSEQISSNDVMCKVDKICQVTPTERSQESSNKSKNVFSEYSESRNKGPPSGEMSSEDMVFEVDKSCRVKSTQKNSDKSEKTCQELHKSGNEKHSSGEISLKGVLCENEKNSEIRQTRKGRENSYKGEKKCRLYARRLSLDDTKCKIIGHHKCAKLERNHKKNSTGSASSYDGPAKYSAIQSLHKAGCYGVLQDYNFQPITDGTLLQSKQTNVIGQQHNKSKYEYIQPQICCTAVKLQDRKIKEQRYQGFQRPVRVSRPYEGHMLKQNSLQCLPKNLSASGESCVLKPLDQLSHEKPGCESEQNLTDLGQSKDAKCSDGVLRYAEKVDVGQSKDTVHSDGVSACFKKKSDGQSKCEGISDGKKKEAMGGLSSNGRKCTYSWMKVKKKNQPQRESNMSINEKSIDTGQKPTAAGEGNNLESLKLHGSENAEVANTQSPWKQASDFGATSVQNALSDPWAELKSTTGQVVTEADVFKCPLNDCGGQVLYGDRKKGDNHVGHRALLYQLLRENPNTKSGVQRSDTGSLEVNPNKDKGVIDKPSIGGTIDSLPKVTIVKIPIDHVTLESANVRLKSPTDHSRHITETHVGASEGIKSQDHSRHITETHVSASEGIKSQDHSRHITETHVSASEGIKSQDHSRHITETHVSASEGIKSNDLNRHITETLESANDRIKLPMGYRRHIAETPESANEGIESSTDHSRHIAETPESANEGFKFPHGHWRHTTEMLVPSNDRVSSSMDHSASHIDESHLSANEGNSSIVDLVRQITETLLKGDTGINSNIEHTSHYTETLASTTDETKSPGNHLKHITETLVSADQESKSHVNHRRSITETLVPAKCGTSSMDNDIQNITESYLSANDGNKSIVDHVRRITETLLKANEGIVSPADIVKHITETLINKGTKSPVSHAAETVVSANEGTKSAVDHVNHMVENLGNSTETLVSANERTKSRVDHVNHMAENLGNRTETLVSANERTKSAVDCVSHMAEPLGSSTETLVSANEGTKSAVDHVSHMTEPLGSSTDTLVSANEGTKSAVDHVSHITETAVSANKEIMLPIDHARYIAEALVSADERIKSAVDHIRNIEKLVSADEEIKSALDHVSDITETLERDSTDEGKLPVNHVRSSTEILVSADDRINTAVDHARSSTETLKNDDDDGIKSPLDHIENTTEVKEGIRTPASLVKRLLEKPVDCTFDSDIKSPTFQVNSDTKLSVRTSGVIDIMSPGNESSSHVDYVNPPESNKSYRFLECVQYHPISLPLGCYKYEEDEVVSDGNYDTDCSLENRMAKLGQDKYNTNVDKSSTLMHWVVEKLDDIPKPVCRQQALQGKHVSPGDKRIKNVKSSAMRKLDFNMTKSVDGREENNNMGQDGRRHETNPKASQRVGSSGSPRSNSASSKTGHSVSNTKLVEDGNKLKTVFTNLLKACIDKAQRKMKHSLVELEDALKHCPDPDLLTTENILRKGIVSDTLDSNIQNKLRCRTENSKQSKSPVLNIPELFEICSKNELQSKSETLLERDSQRDGCRVSSKKKINDDRESNILKDDKVESKRCMSKKLDYTESPLVLKFQGKRYTRSYRGNREGLDTNTIERTNNVKCMTENNGNGDRKSPPCCTTHISEISSLDMCESGTVKTCGYQSHGSKKSQSQVLSQETMEEDDLWNNDHVDTVCYHGKDTVSKERSIQKERVMQNTQGNEQEIIKESVSKRIGGSKVDVGKEGTKIKQDVEMCTARIETGVEWEKGNSLLIGSPVPSNARRFIDLSATLGSSSSSENSERNKDGKALEATVYQKLGEDLKDSVIEKKRGRKRSRSDSDSDSGSMVLEESIGMFLDVESERVGSAENEETVHKRNHSEEKLESDTVPLVYTGEKVKDVEHVKSANYQKSGNSEHYATKRMKSDVKHKSPVKGKAMNGDYRRLAVQGKEVSEECCKREDESQKMKTTEDETVICDGTEAMDQSNTEVCMSEEFVHTGELKSKSNRDVDFLRNISQDKEISEEWEVGKKRLKTTESREVVCDGKGEVDAITKVVDRPNTKILEEVVQTSRLEQRNEPNNGSKAGRKTSEICEEYKDTQTDVEENHEGLGTKKNTLDLGHGRQELSNFGTKAWPDVQVVCHDIRKMRPDIKSSKPPSLGQQQIRRSARIMIRGAKKLPKKEKKKMIKRLKKLAILGSVIETQEIFDEKMLGTKDARQPSKEDISRPHKQSTSSLEQENKALLIEAGNNQDGKQQSDNRDSVRNVLLKNTYLLRSKEGVDKINDRDASSLQLKVTNEKRNTGPSVECSDVGTTVCERVMSTGTKQETPTSCGQTDQSDSCADDILKCGTNTSKETKRGLLTGSEGSEVHPHQSPDRKKMKILSTEKQAIERCPRRKNHLKVPLPKFSMKCLPTYKKSQLLKSRFRLITDRDQQASNKSFRRRKCCYCRSYFPWDTLHRHILDMHPFRCGRCGLTFDCKESRDEHRKDVHIDELHHCMVCRRTFSSIRLYNHHCRAKAHIQYQQIQSNVVHMLRNIIVNCFQKTDTEVPQKNNPELHNAQFMDSQVLNSSKQQRSIGNADKDCDAKTKDASKLSRNLQVGLRQPNTGESSTSESSPNYSEMQPVKEIGFENSTSDHQKQVCLHNMSGEAGFPLVLKENQGAFDQLQKFELTNRKGMGVKNFYYNDPEVKMLGKDLERKIQSLYTRFSKLEYVDLISYVSKYSVSDISAANCPVLPHGAGQQGQPLSFSIPNISSTSCPMLPPAAAATQSISVPFSNPKCASANYPVPPFGTATQCQRPSYSLQNLPTANYLMPPVAASSHDQLVPVAPQNFSESTKTAPPTGDDEGGWLTKAVQVVQDQSMNFNLPQDGMSAYQSGSGLTSNNLAPMKLRYPQFNSNSVSCDMQSDPSYPHYNSDPQTLEMPFEIESDHTSERVMTELTNVRGQNRSANTLMNSLDSNYSKNSSTISHGTSKGLYGHGEYLPMRESEETDGLNNQNDQNFVTHTEGAGTGSNLDSQEIVSTVGTRTGSNLDSWELESSVGAWTGSNLGSQELASSVETWTGSNFDFQKLASSVGSQTGSNLDSEGLVSNSSVGSSSMPHVSEDNTLIVSKIMDTNSKTSAFSQGDIVTSSPLSELCSHDDSPSSCASADENHMDTCTDQTPSNDQRMYSEGEETFYGSARHSDRLLSNLSHDSCLSDDSVASPCQIDVDDQSNSQSVEDEWKDILESIQKDVLTSEFYSCDL